MRRAGQTPHGARPNREGAWGGLNKPPEARACSARHNLPVGRLSRAVMRGPEEWPSCRSNPADRIRLTGPAATNLFYCFIHIEHLIACWLPLWHSVRGSVASILAIWVRD